MLDLRSSDDDARPRCLRTKTNARVFAGDTLTHLPTDSDTTLVFNAMRSIQAIAS